MLTLRRLTAALQVGMGMGEWTQDKVSTYNLENPPMRDTATVLFDNTDPNKAWVAFRWVARLCAVCGLV